MDSLKTSVFIVDSSPFILFVHGAVLVLGVGLSTLNGSMQNNK